MPRNPIRIFTCFLAFFTSIISSFAQKEFINISFTAIDSTDRVQLDSIRIINRNIGWDTVIYWPDTTITVEIFLGDTLLNIGYTTDYSVGIIDHQQEENSFLSLESYPNPTKNQTNVRLYIPDNGTTNILITDNLGRAVAQYQKKLEKGVHNFKFIPSVSSFYFFTVHWNGYVNTTKIINTSTNNTACKLEYLGLVNKEYDLTTKLFKKNPIVKESGIIDTPESNANYTFQFATRIPCIGTPTVTYDGQTYNTIQIFSQCWLKENLNVGIMIPGNTNMSDNNVFEKYCYTNQPDSCAKYGGLYQWSEMMQYEQLQGTQGICPPGWHIPSDEEWKVLEGAADTQYAIGDPEWDLYLLERGFDGGSNLKTSSGWPVGGNGTDILYFSGLPAGDRYTNGAFALIGEYASFWTSSEFYVDYAWTRNFIRTYPGVWRDWYDDKLAGYSVRCIRNEDYKSH